MHKSIFFFSLLFSLFVGCAEKSSEQIGFGSITDGVYKHDYFNLSFNIPEEWSLQSQATQQEMMEMGGELMFSDDESTKRAIDRAVEQNAVTLFSLFKYEIDTPVEFNPNIIAVAEKISHIPGIQQPSDYFDQVKDLLGRGNLEYSFPDDIYSKELAGVTFDVMPMQLSILDSKVFQEQYITFTKGYVLLFNISYSTEAEKQELVQLFEGLQFHPDNEE